MGVGSVWVGRDFPFVNEHGSWEVKREDKNRMGGRQGRDYTPGRCEMTNNTQAIDTFFPSIMPTSKFQPLMRRRACFFEDIFVSHKLLLRLIRTKEHVAYPPDR